MKQCLKVGDAEVVQLASLPHLSRLALIQCELVTDRGLIAVLESAGQRLVDLNVQGLAQLTDKAVATIARKCPKLCHLDLSFLPEITDEGMSKLAGACKSLRSLRLARCVELTDVSVTALLDSNRQLTHVSLHSLDKLTAASGVALSQLPHLQDVDVSLCRDMDVTDAFIDALLSHCPQLCKVRAWACLRLTEESLRHRPSHPNFELIGCATVV